MTAAVLPQSWAARPGRRNLITDVAGLAVGNAQDRRAWTGVTVVLPDRPAVASVAMLGGAPGTVETDLLDPAGMVDAVDAIVLAGGSAFGLDAAGAVRAALARQGRGFRVGAAVVPIVPGAILFDLNNGGAKGWGAAPPYRRLGTAALAAAARDFALGTAGAAYGAQAGGLKGGLGSASAVTADGLRVGALAAVNSWGETVAPGTDRFWAAPFERGRELGGRGLPAHAEIDRDRMPTKLEQRLAALRGHTTLAVVATDATLDKAAARRVALMAHDGLARAIRPVHTPVDGDIVFALATGRRPRPDTIELMRIGALAADCLARAVARGVYEATTLGAMPGYRSVHS